MDRKFARWAKENLTNRFEAIVTLADRNIIAKLDDKIKGARIFLTQADVELLERVEIELIESDIAGGKIYAKVVRSLENV